MGIPTLVLLALQIRRETGQGPAVSRNRRDVGGDAGSAVDDTPGSSDGRRLGAELASARWMAALLAGVLLLGFQIGAPTYVFAYVRIRARLSWSSATLMAVGTGAALRAFSAIVPALRFQEGMVRLW